MSPFPFAFRAIIAEHDGRNRTRLVEAAFDAAGRASLDAGGARWEATLTSQPSATADASELTFTARVLSGQARSVAVGLTFTDEAWTVENYVLIPGAVYRGNRFPSLRRPYPPVIRDIGQRDNKLRLDIGDIPRLSAEPGRSHLDQTSLDAATPGLGVFFPGRRQAFLCLTAQTASHGPYGFEVIENADRTRADIFLLVPGFLHPLPGDNDPQSGYGNLATAHRHPENARPADLATGESISFSFQLHWFPCADVPALFDRVLTHRTAMFPEGKPLPEIMPFSATWDVLHAKHNAQNWNEKFGLYQIGIPWAPNQDTQFWQSGWCGGGIPTLAMIQHGDATALARSLRNLDFLLTQAVSEFGLFKAIMSDKGKWTGDGKEGGDQPWCLVRRQGDCLVFALRQLMLLQERGHAFPARWLDTVRRVATALCDVWDREGDFGFQLNFNTGRLEIHGSTSGALIPAGLALASRLFHEPRFLAAAQSAAEYFRTHDLAWGVTTGGPGDAAQAPDGESIFGLIESFITLYEFTGEARWLVAARQACAQGASWAISYPYRFPATSTLGELAIDARGALIANTQNKCGVPGICTQSGQGILRTFRATGDTRLLDVLREIAHSMPQLLSRADRLIPTRMTWGNPSPHLPAGWMCERVNITPSWPEPLGEQAAYSCWCEVAMMLTWNDLPGVYAQPDTGLIRTLDHVRAEWADAARKSLRLTNPTKFAARVRLMVETAAVARAHPLPANFAASLPLIAVPAGESVIIHP